MHRMSELGIRSNIYQNKKLLSFIFFPLILLNSQAKEENHFEQIERQLKFEEKHRFLVSGLFY